MPHCSGCWEAFLKTAASLNAKVYEERGGKVVGNLAWSSELHCQGPPPTTNESLHSTVAVEWHHAALCWHLRP